MTENHGNILQIFNEITGADSDATEADKILIDHWASKNKWGPFEFRQYFDHEWKSEKSRNWLLSQPGRVNIRTFLNLKNEERIIGVLNDLRQMQAIQKKAAAAAAQDYSDIRINKLRLSCCGGIFEQKFIKVPCPCGIDPKTNKTYHRHHWEQGNQLEYEKHFSECFAESMEKKRRAGEL